MFAVEGGQVREQAAAIVGDPRATCRIKEHALKVEGGRLSGPMQIQTDAATEKIELNVTLDKGGTYSAVFGVQQQREGQVSVRPGTESQLRELLAPILSYRTPWRVWLVTGPRVTRNADGKMAAMTPGSNPPRPQAYSAKTAYLSELPPDNWTSRDCDDSLWARYADDLYEFMGHKSGLIRWIKTEKGLQPDFTLFEKYLDLYARCGRLARVGLEFWPGVSQYRAPIWGCFPLYVAGHGADGPVPT
ncbi:MAG: hypothetical protein ABR915_24655, partial [Thermoguttaceae bacterium]